ncbi:MAG: NifB/NifX family molybdenum-iron cluster-binding protein [Bryobacteraceae bacterium]
MKVAVTAQGNTQQSPVDPRFGRARFLVIVDSETGASWAVDNQPNLDAVQGAGVQAARKIVELGVSALITGHVGPKAFSALQAGGVTVYTDAQGSVAEAIQQFQQGRLAKASAPDVEGHW